MFKKKIISGFFITLLVFVSFEAWAGGLKSNSALTANKQGKVSKEIEKLRNLRRSQINIFKNREEIKVFLFAEDEKVEILKGSYCGGEDGDKQYAGNYQLISVKGNKIVSKIDLGKDYEFIENTQHDGLHMFVPVFGEQLVAIYQYVSCNHENVEFFRINEYGLIHRVNFFEKDGIVVTGKLVIGDISVTTENIFFCSYDNVIAYYLCDTYVYNGKDFIQTSSWMGSYYYNPNEKNTNIREARRVLYEYLNALRQEGTYKKADYKKVVYYYGGDYNFLLQLNPDVNIEDKPKLFERYCTKNRGNCSIEPSYFIDIASPSEVKFGVKEGGFEVNMKPDFEFRVKRMNGEFKVMDLPPRTSQK